MSSGRRSRAGADLGAGAFEQAGSHGAVHVEWRKRGDDVVFGQCVTEQEQSDRDADRPRGAGGAACGHRLGAAERRMRRATEDVEQGIGLIADSRE